MVEFSTSPTARDAADIVDALGKVIGVAAASRWMLAACPALGEACSPVMALR